MKIKFIIIWLLVLFSWNLCQAQTRKVETDTLKFRGGLKVRQSGVWKDVTTFFDNLNASNQTLTAAYADSQITLQKMTTAAVNYIGSGGSVTNNPDDITLENKSGSTIGITHSYLVDTVGVAILDSIQPFKNLDFVTPQDFGDPDTIGNGSYDDTEEINWALSQTGHVWLPRPDDGQYIISSTLSIPSNTTLEIEPGTEIFLAADADTYMVCNANIADGIASYDSNIVIIGGRWNGNDINQTNGLYPNSQGHAFFIDSVKHLTIRDLMIKDVKRFGIWVSNFENVTCENILFDTEKDGLDFYGGRDLYVNNIRGHTGDDMIALKIYDYSSFYQVPGDITDVTIKNVQAYDVDTTDANAYGCQSLVAMVGGADATGDGYKYKNIYVSNLRGNVNTYPIRIFTGVVGAEFWIDGQQYTNIEDMVIDKVNGETSTYPNVRFKPSFAENIIIRNIIIADSNAQAAAVEMGDTTTLSTYTDVRLENIHGNSIHGALITMEDNTDFVRLKMDNISGANSPTSFLIYTTGDINIKESWNITNIHADSTKLFQWNTTTTTDPGVVVNINGFSIRDISAPISLKNDLILNLSNGLYDSVTYAYQTSGAGNTFRILGDGNVWSRKEPFGWQDGNCTLSQNNPSISIDVDTYLTPQDLDVVYSRSTSSTAAQNAVVQFIAADSLWHLYQNKYVLYDFSLDPPSIGTLAGWDTTYTITGLSTTQDLIVLDMPYDLNDNFIYSARIDANNTVRLKLFNTSGGAINQAATVDSVRIFVYDQP